MADPQLDPVPNNDLWETAWKLVKEGDLKQYAETYDKILLATSATSTSRALQPDRPKLLLELVDKRAKTLKKGRWGFVISGRKFGVGDIIDKIVTGILYAENLIGQAVRAAGEPHAALAWAGVCLLLPLVVNSNTQDKDALELLDAITDRIHQYRVRETVFRSPATGTTDSEDTKKLREEFVIKTTDLYAEILKAQILLARKFARARFMQYLRDVAKFDDWKSTKQNIFDLDNGIKGIVQDLGAKSIARMETNLVELLEGQNRSDDEKKFDCLQALSSTLDYLTCKNQISERIPGTFEWFLRKDGKFDKWRNATDTQMMFVTGGAGCGKSVLLKSLVDGELASTDRRVTCYFFFKEGNSQQESALEALCALLHQLLCQAPHLIEFALPHYINFGKETFSAQFAALWKILSQCAKAYDGEVLCVLDGLDECQAEDVRVTTTRSSHRREELTDGLKAIYTNPANANANDGTLKFLVSARKTASEEFGPFMSENWSDVSADGGLSDQDLRLFVDHKIPALALREDVKGTLRAELLEVQGKSRTYLWLSLILKTLGSAQFRDRESVDLVTFIREELPNSVEEAFARVLPAKEHEAMARIIFHIIFAARRLLTLSELSEAFEFAKRGNGNLKGNLNFQSASYFEETLTTYCGCFITVISIEEVKTVTFFHQKAREFLLKTDFALEDSKKLLRNYCISYLKYQGSKDVEKEILSPSSEPLGYDRITNSLRAYVNRHPFLCYAAVNWIYHLPFEAEDPTIRKQIATEIAPICDVGSPLFRTWFLCCWCLWGPGIALRDFFKQYIHGWIPDHIYPNAALVEKFAELNECGKQGDERDKWWFWTISSEPDDFAKLLEICGGPKSDDSRRSNIVAQGRTLTDQFSYDSGLYSAPVTGMDVQIFYRGKISQGS